ncbi:MAG: BON domain-containing protein [Pseudomonadota bacterium]|nr:BON domain-containing protein [Pseudomonadota bacterium]
MKTINAGLLATLLAAAVGSAFAQSTTTTTTTTVRSPLVTSTDTRDPVKSDAVDKCAQASGSSKTGCVVGRDGKVTTVNGTTVTEKTKDVARTAVDKTKAAASAVAQKTENMVDRAGSSKTAAAADRGVDKTAAAASDSVITTKVKASIFAEPELKSMGIHVETEKGVVMLSGFVNTKAEADKAVAAAKTVEGVSNVKTAIKVK